MVFSSYYFVFYFLPVALGLYHLSPRRVRLFALTVLSYTFYGWTNPLLVLLLGLSTAIDYVCSRVLVGSALPDDLVEGRLKPDAKRNRIQRGALLLSIVTNLSILGFFKYFSFFVDNVDAAAASLGIELNWAVAAWRVVLPAGLSFYTLQSMSYTIDVYRGEVAPTRNPVTFACYVSLFPQLVAGPIVRFSQLGDQLAQRRCTSEQFARGIMFLCLGLAKKVLLANPCSVIADTTFDAAAVGAGDAWLGVIAYSMQIYFDFSGYSDMAIGLGLMLGFALPINFDSPYRARSLRDFWRRWHITLSQWLRDYLYIPLGGNRKGTSRAAVNVFLVMLIGGLWHGAAWTFVLWGACHGIGLIVERALAERSGARVLPGFVRVMITFSIVSLAWVFFRSDSFSHAMQYFAMMFGAGDGAMRMEVVGSLVHRPYLLGTLLLAMVVVWICPPTVVIAQRITLPRAVFALILFAICIAMLTTQAYNPFIYFIF